MTTNVAIILGTVVAGLIFTYLHGVDEVSAGHPYWWSGFFFITVALVGWSSSLFIGEGRPAADPHRPLRWNPIDGLREVKFLAEDRALLGAVLATGWFYLVGALALSVLNVCGKEVLDLGDGGSRLFFLCRQRNRHRKPAGQPAFRRPHRDRYRPHRRNPDDLWLRSSAVRQ